MIEKNKLHSSSWMIKNFLLNNSIKLQASRLLNWDVSSSIHSLSVSDGSEWSFFGGVKGGRRDEKILREDNFLSINPLLSSIYIEKLICRIICKMKIFSLPSLSETRLKSTTSYFSWAAASAVRRVQKTFTKITQPKSAADFNRFRFGYTILYIWRLVKQLQFFLTKSRRTISTTFFTPHAAACNTR